MSNLSVFPLIRSYCNSFLFTFILQNMLKICSSLELLHFTRSLLPQKSIKCVSEHISKYHATSNTVFALSSGHGTCGVAVIRITGSKSGCALLKLTGKTKLPPARRAQFKKLVHPTSNEILDHALTLWLPGMYSC